MPSACCPQSADSSDEDEKDVGDSSSDDDDMSAARKVARAKALAVIPGSHLGDRVREYALPLLPGERVLQVITAIARA